MPQFENGHLIPSVGHLDLRSSNVCGELREDFFWWRKNDTPSLTTDRWEAELALRMTDSRAAVWQILSNSAGGISSFFGSMRGMGWIMSLVLWK
jgi:hypothetical protein